MLFVLACFLRSPTSNQMSWHDQDISAARHALVRGDLVAYGEAMRMLGEGTPVPSLPAELAEHEVELTLRVREARAVESIPAAGIALGRVEAACGTCHTQVGQGPQARPSDPPGPEQIMDRHAWAVGAIEDGLVRGDVGEIERGALVLDFTPVVASGELTESLQEQLHEDASAIARVGATLDERGQAFGRVLGTCAACHQETGGGPDGVPP